MTKNSSEVCWGRKTIWAKGGFWWDKLRVIVLPANSVPSCYLYLLLVGVLLWSADMTGQVVLRGKAAINKEGLTGEGRKLRICIKYRWLQGPRHTRTRPTYYPVMGTPL